MKQWEVWFAKFPYEEDANKLSERPVIVLDVKKLEVLSVKVTTHEIRDTDEFDTTIDHWKEAGLDNPSVARVAKTIYLSEKNFIFKIGDLQPDDQNAIAEQYMRFIQRNS